MHENLLIDFIIIKLYDKYRDIIVKTGWEVIFLKTFSIKRRILYILMGIIIPLIIYILVFNLDTVRVMNEKVTEAISNTIYLQSENLSNTLTIVENSMAGIISENESFGALRNEKLTKTEKYLNAYNVMKAETSIMYAYSDISACALISRPGNVNRIVFNTNYTVDDTDRKLIEYLKSLLAKNQLLKEHIWFPAKVGNRGYLFRIMGVKDTCIVYIINLNNITLFQDNKKGENSAVTVFFDQDTIYIGEKFVKANEISIKSSDQSYYTGRNRNYIVCEAKIKGCKMRTAYLTSFNGFIVNMNSRQVIFFILSLMTIFMIPLGYILLKRMFFRPIDRLMKSMERIGANDYNQEEMVTYREIEFQKVDETLHHTLEEIKKLKIASYENELQMKSTMLQYYQIQIRPHFYLNCLKNIYGMVEEKNYNNIQKLILYLSRHLRYMLQEDSILVSIEEELQYVKNYISIQQISMKYPPECMIDVDTDVIHCQIPAISILSFVENSVKYSISPDGNLQIKIKVQLLENDDSELIYIRIADNGGGFIEEDLKKYNYFDSNINKGEHIGIYNVIQRFQLYFGKENVGFAFANENGAVVEIYVKKVGI